LAGIVGSNRNFKNGLPPIPITGSRRASIGRQSSPWNILVFFDFISPMPREKIHFITGQLARAALDNVLSDLATKADFDYSVQTLPITVAALLTPKWIAPRLEIPPDTTQIMLPGYCDIDLSPIRNVTDLPIAIGPKDLRRLPDHFGQVTRREGFGDWDIEIIAEINHAPRKSLDEIISLAASMRADGANLIDVGCDPNNCWPGVAECVRALKAEGHRVSVDSLNPDEIEPAVAAGAELVLSVNQSNYKRAVDWGCEVIVIPDDIQDIASMDATIDFLAGHNVPIRIDPILEPIGFGFTASIQRYIKARKRWPEAEMMMGIGNITELSDVDSAGVNFLLLAICQELKITKVLTTQVINWARTSVKECDIARQLVHYSITENVPPKHLSEQLLLLRDAKLLNYSPQQIEQLAANIKDNNYRILAENDLLHLLGSRQHFSGRDPFDVFDQLMQSQPTNVDASHAFYLGYEMCKAMTALQLGKQYAQDQSLDWGFLTVDEEDRHRLKKRRKKRDD
jgi:dihydropteroate synthase